MKILIVDDEPRIREVIKEYCLSAQYDIIEAENGAVALNMLKLYQDIDMIILDVMMPQLDGLSAYKEIKKHYDIPTIILSARSEEFDKLTGFELGVDDYLTKPFSPKELMARIKAVAKRTYHTNDTYHYHTLSIDTIGHTVSINEELISLTPKEYDLLVCFFQNKGVALSREQLLNEVWGYDFFGDDRTVDTHVKMLRNNLGIYRDIITTVRGVGYKLEIKAK